MSASLQKLVRALRCGTRTETRLFHAVKLRVGRRNARQNITHTVSTKTIRASRLLAPSASWVIPAGYLVAASAKTAAEGATISMGLMLVATVTCGAERTTNACLVNMRVMHCWLGLSSSWRCLSDPQVSVSVCLRFCVTHVCIERWLMMFAAMKAIELSKHLGALHGPIMSLVPTPLNGSLGHRQFVHWNSVLF